MTHGSGEGAAFQRLSKESPAFAAEFAAIGFATCAAIGGPSTPTPPKYFLTRTRCFFVSNRQ